MEKLDRLELSEITNSSILIRGKVRLSIVRGDITKSKDDAIVTYAEQKLIVSEEAAAAPGGLQLQCKTVLRCSCAEFENEAVTRRKLKELVNKCLTRAATKRYESVSFPALGVDIGYPPEAVARWIIEAIFDHCDMFPRSSLSNATVYLYGRDTKTHKGFDDVMYELMSRRIREKHLTQVTPGGFVINGKVKLKIFKGNIAEAKEEAIVNSTRRDFDLSRGKISSALAQIAGGDLQKACTARMPLEEEAVVETDGFKLRCKKVLHCNVPSYEDEETSKLKFRNVIKKCLTISATNRFKSIAFPALGTGNMQYPPEEAARFMIEEIIEYCEMFPRSSLSAIKIYLFDQATLEGYREFMSGWRFKDVSDVHLLIYNRIHLDLIIGDLTNSIEDTIVNSTGEDVNLSVSLAKVLAKKAGPDFVKACSDIAPLSEGSVTETGSFNMPCKQILHCNIKPWDRGQDRTGLKSIVERCLKNANAKGHRSIAFPALGMGAKRYPAKIVCKSIVEAVAEYSKRNPLSSLATVKLYLYEEEVTSGQIEVFQWVLRKLGCVKESAGFSFDYKTQLTFIKGDLAETKVNVLVNSSGSHMALSEGNVSVALMNKAGEALQDECSRLAPMLTGEIVMTDGFGLPCDKVLHVCCPHWKPRESEQALRDLIVKCLKWANDLKATSIAFPAVGTGILNYPPKTVARCFVHASADFAKTNRKGTVKDIRLVLFSAETSSIQSVEKALKLELEEQEVEQTDTRPKTDAKIVIELPSIWEPPSYAYNEFVVNKKTKEFEDLVADFIKTLNRPGCVIIEAKRIQNPNNYQLYDTMKKTVTRKLNKLKETDVETAPLWHGTKESNVRKITTSKFDRGLSGAVGANLLGAGCYFSVTAHYSSSDMFSPPNSKGERFMILARVITGTYCVGTPDLKTAPYRDSSSPLLEQFDSVVDNKANPTMFAVFHDAAAYPEYVIKYKY